MNISILAVGTELLMGKTINTNATELSKALNNLGHTVHYHLTIGDNPKRLASTLEYLLSVSDMIITTGGLGPTQDDLTKETISETLGLKMQFNEEAYTQMINRFKSFNVTMTQNNKKQAYLPEGSIPMYNDKGTAPGFIAEANNKIIAALPGPPHEMRHMYFKSLEPYLANKTTQCIKSEYINLFGIGESSAESKIEDIISEQTNPTIAIYANIGQVSLRVTSSASNDTDALKLLKPTVDAITERLQPYVIGYGEHDIMDYTVEQIKQNNLTLSLAESCTGGLIASEFIKYSGASQFFQRGYVTYSNQSKHEILNVKNSTLEDFGAVSEETCNEMIEGLFTNSQSDICLAVTGIAGPTGGTTDKPVGLVYIGVKVKETVIIKQFNFTGDRTVIRRRSLLNGFFMIYDTIKKTCN